MILLAALQVSRFDPYLRKLVAVDLFVYNGSKTTSDLTHHFRSSSSLSSGNKQIKGYELAFDQSYGFFDDVTEQDWKLHQEWARKQGNHRYVFEPTRHWGRPALWYYNNYNPIFSCPHAKRIAGIGDGPKWVCDPHRLARQVERRKETGDNQPECLIYSVGSNGNFEFEDGLVGYVGKICEIHIFDYSEDYNRKDNEERNMHFHQLGLQGSQQNRGEQFASFQEILTKLGHENRTIDILKIDCEGCEWDTYRDWIGYDIRQVLVETHRLPSNTTLGFDFFNSFKQNSLVMFSKEVNGHGRGECYEFSYLKLHPDFLHQGDTLYKNMEETAKASV